MFTYNNINKESEYREYISGEKLINTNIFIEAGAGAGKTTISVQRVMTQIAAGVPVEQIVMITFTNAAANEIYGRIQQKLNAKYFSEEDSQLKKRYGDALMNIDRMKISTIHSFCHSMVSEKPFSAGLDYGVKLLDDSQAKEQQRKFFDSYYMDNPVSKTQFGFFRTKNGATDDSVRRKLSDIFIEYCDLRDIRFCTNHNYDDENLYGHDSTNRTAFDALNTMLSDITQLYNDQIESGADKDKVKANMVKKFRDIIDEVGAHYYTSADYIAIYKKVKKYVEVKKDDKYDNIFLAKITKGTDLQDSARMVIENDNSISFEAYYLHIHSICTKYVSKAVEEYHKTCSREEISNDALLYYTREMLKNDPEARAFFKKKYTHIYIDEFQDTDFLQAEIMLYLGCDEKSLAENSGDVWKSDLNDGALFVVGDPKQSIYAFRGADVNVYNKVREIFGSDEKKNCEFIMLNYNFRSDVSLTQWVNDVFQKPVDDKKDMNYFPMVSMAYKHTESELPKLLSGFYKKPVPDKDALLDEYEELAECVQNMVDSEYQIFDKDHYRNVMYSDILIIVYNTTNTVKWIKAFCEKNIPVNMLGKISQQENNPLTKLIILCRYLSDSSDNSAREAVYECLFNLTPDSACDDVQAYAEKITEIDNWLMWLFKKYNKCADGISMLYEFLEYPQLIFAGSKNYSSDLSNVVQLIEKWENSDYHNLSQLAELMEEEREKDMERQLCLDGKKGNFVRFMNLHKAKGLEGNIVIMADFAKNQGFKDNSYTDHIGGRVNIAVPSGSRLVGTKWVPTCFDTLSYFYSDFTSAKDNYESERLRLEYVAATRAKQAFIFYYPEEKSGKTFPFFSLNFLSKCNELQIISQPKQTQTAAVKELSDYAEEISQRRENFNSTIAEKSKVRTVKLTPSRLEKSKKLPAVTEKVKIVRPVGRAIGLIVHRAFELAVQNRKLFLDDVNSNAAQQMLEKISKRAFIDYEDDWTGEFSRESGEDYVITQLKAFFAQSYVKTLLADADDVFTEMPFHTEFDSPQEGIRERVFGIMDLVVRKKNKFYIIDYKTNKRSQSDEKAFMDRLSEEYSGQLSLYKKVLCDLSGSTPEEIEVRLYSMNDEKYLKS